MAWTVGVPGGGGGGGGSADDGYTVHVCLNGP